MTPDSARSGFGHGAEISAVAHALPSEVVDNDEFVRRCRFSLGRPVEELARETQVEARRWCAGDENTWTLARSAVHRLLEREPRLREEIDVVVVASGTTMPLVHPTEPEHPGMADLAPLVLRELGRDDALGIDVKACYCTGFLRGLQVADGLLASRACRAALVVATEQGSRFATAATNRSGFCFLMADGAGAMVLRRRSERIPSGLLDHVGVTFASRYEWVGIGDDAESTVMRGARAGEATVEMLVGCGKKLLSRNRLRAGDVQWLLPIQTHAGIVRATAESLGFPEEKRLWDPRELGFSGSASIPVALSMALEGGRVLRGDLVLCVAVGAGMNAAGTLLRV